MIRRRTLLPLTLLLLAACTPGGAPSSPPSSSAPTPTPIGNPVARVDEAARLVIASDPRFAGVTKFDPELIGASAWWEGTATTTGFEITITIGWGDCPAGCINKHVWRYAVGSDASVSLIEESGDPLPPGSLPA